MFKVNTTSYVFAVRSITLPKIHDIVYYSDSKKQKELKQFETMELSMVVDNKCGTTATSNTEPEYAVINDGVHATGDYDFVKCPAYSYVSTKM